MKAAHRNPGKQQATSKAASNNTPHLQHVTNHKEITILKETNDVMQPDKKNKLGSIWHAGP